MRERVDGLRDASHDILHLRLNGLGILGQSALQEALVVIAADIDQHGRVVRSLMAVQVRDISGELVREIDRQGMPGRGVDQNRRRCVAGFRSRERAIVKSHVQHFGQLFGVGGTVGGSALPGRRRRLADQVEQIAVVRQTVSENDQSGVT